MALPPSTLLDAFPVSCSGGLLLDKGTLSMPEGSALQLQNYEPAVTGGYRRINGYTKFSSTAVSGTGPIRGLFIYNDTVVAARDTHIEYGTGTTWTSITSSQTSGTSQYNFDVYDFGSGDTLIMTNGVDYASTWDGSTFTVMNGSIGSGSGTAPTAPSSVVAFQNHMFYAEDNLLTFSAPFTENDFTPANGAGTINIMDTIQQLKIFRNFLIVFCKDSIYKITGTSLADFALEHIADDIGVVSGATVQELGGDLVFLSPDGLRTLAGTERIDDTELGTISSNVQTRFSSLTGGEVFTSLVIRSKNQYRVWFPLSGTAPNSSKGMMAVLKNNNTWEFADLKGIKPGYATSGFYNGEELIIHGDYSSGIIYTQESGNDFDGTYIEALFRSPDLPITDIGTRKTVHRVLLEIDNEGTLSTDFYILYDGEAIATPQPDPYSISATGGRPVYDTAVYDTDLYSSGSTIVLRQAVEGSGFTVAIKFKETASSAPFVIRGFQIEYVLGDRR